MVIRGPETKISTSIKTLVKFLCQNISKQVSLKNDKQIIIPGGFDQIEKCYKVHGETVFEVPELQSNH